MRRSLPTAIFTALLCSWPPASTGAQENQSRIERIDVTIEGASYPVSVVIPEGYTPARRWPVILLLHGAGSRGTDGIRPVQRFAPLVSPRYPAIVVLPQLPPQLSWQDRGTDMALAALDSTMARFAGDSDRVYLMGVSMGGNGVWAVGWRAPERFAAMVAMCGFVVARRGTSGTDYAPIAPDNSHAAVAARFRAMPVWLFHGDADAQIPVDETRRLAAAFRSARAPAQYTELPGLGHDIASAVLTRADLAAWLLTQRRGRAP